MKLFIAGHNGMVGAALVRRFRIAAEATLILRSHRELDLTDAHAVRDFYKKERPDVVIIAAAKVGGIFANDTYPAEFIFQNLSIASNAIDGAFHAGVERVLFLGSSCIYPKFAPQPMSEDCLLTGALEPTNEAYAIAKITGLKLCEFYRKQYGVCYHSAMPTNLYGPGDNYHPLNSHVLPALIRRFHDAKEMALPEVVAWGSGSPCREFLYVDDLADACAFLLDLKNPPNLVNIGTGTDITIKELTENVAKIVGFNGVIHWDETKPDGTPRKLLDISLMKKLGWNAKVSLKEGIEKTYKSFLNELGTGRLRQ